MGAKIHSDCTETAPLTEKNTKFIQVAEVFTRRIKCCAEETQGGQAELEGLTFMAGRKEPDKETGQK